MEDFQRWEDIQGSIDKWKKVLEKSNQKLKGKVRGKGIIESI